MGKRLSPEEYSELFSKTVKKLLRRKSFTVDDVVEAIGSPPQGRTALGGLIQKAANDYGLSPVGKTQSRQASRRKSLVTVWSR